MAITFGSKARVKPKTKSSHRRAVVKHHHDGTFYAIVSNGDVLPLVEDYDKARVYYSRPANDEHEHWHKHKRSPMIDTKGNEVPLSMKTLGVVKRYWATVKPRLKIVGDIIDGKFVMIYTDE